MGAFLVSCYYSFRVQRYVCCMIHVRYEYSFSQAALDERRSGCAPYILVRLSSLGMAEEVRPDMGPTRALGNV
jgi:hypothetical protein